MKKLLKGFTAALVCLFLNQTMTLASSHREAPLISNDPLADNTDLYAFRSPCDSSKIMLIANYIPFEHPAGGPNWYTFGSNIRYEIHVDNNTATPGDDIIYRFTFSQVNEDPTTFFNIRLGAQNLKTTYNLERSINGGANFTTIVANGIVPPANIGPRSIDDGTVGLGKPYDQLMSEAVATATTGEKVFAGPIDDPFFVDLGGAFDVGGFRKANQGARDGLAKFNCHSLVLEVPIATLQKDHKTELQTTSILDGEYVIGVWASASRPEMTTLDPNGGASTFGGNWIQVSRLGMPLTNEVIIPIGMKDKWNASYASGDGDFVPYFQNPELALYMDDSQYGGAVPGLADLRIQTNSLGGFDFRNGKAGLFPVKGTPAAEGTAFGSTSPYRDILLPDNHSPRAVDLLPIFYTGVPNLPPYQLGSGKNANLPLSVGKPFINNFLPTLTDMLRLNMAVPATKRDDPKFSSLGLIGAAVLGFTEPQYDNKTLQNIPNMDGFPNGRRLEDDVTTIELQAVGGVVLAAIGMYYDDFSGSGNPLTPKFVQAVSFNAGVTKNDTAFKSCFPFVQGPWRGFVGNSYIGPKSNDPLPVKLLGFTAEKSGERVLLRWQVTNEENNDRYEVEYSLDGTRFNKIGTVKSSNGISNNYQLLHGSPDISRANYYRLKQIDVDGKFSYSPVRLVKFGKNLLTITPNPAINFVKIYSSQSPVNINIFDQGGRKVASHVLTNGMLQIDISRFAKGAYTVVAEDKGERIETKRIVKQ